MKGGVQIQTRYSEKHHDSGHYKEKVFIWTPVWLYRFHVMLKLESRLRQGASFSKCDNEQAGVWLGKQHTSLLFALTVYWRWLIPGWHVPQPSSPLPVEGVTQALGSSSEASLDLRDRPPSSNCLLAPEAVPKSGFRLGCDNADHLAGISRAIPWRSVSLWQADWQVGSDANSLLHCSPFQQRGRWINHRASDSDSLEGNVMTTRGLLSTAAEHLFRGCGEKQQKAI